MWITKAALCASLCLLTSCATRSSPGDPLPSECVTVQRAPAMPQGAGIVAPVTEAERSATRPFLSWVAEVVSINEENADRTERGLQGC